MRRRPIPRWWCRVTLRHRGHIDYDRRGIYWECSNCWWRSYVDWADTNLRRVP